MDAYHGLISAKLQKLLEVWKMDNCGTGRDHLNPWTQSWLEIAARVKDSNREQTEWRLLRHWWDGVFPDSGISPPILMSGSSHTEACNALGITDGVTSHC